MPPSPPASDDAIYETYRIRSIELLNNLSKPTPAPASPASPAPASPDAASPDAAPPSDVSKISGTSTILQHNGQVQGLEDLIVFLIKSPTSNEMKLKLNDVYKIFNPNARDIVSKPGSTIPSVTAPIPAAPIPSPPIPSVAAPIPTPPH